MTTSIIGFPRIGAQRELKDATEKYFSHEITEQQLLQTGKILRKQQWQILQEAKIDQIPSNDFSFYDNVLDAAFIFNAIPVEIATARLSKIDKYFALARGYQGPAGDFKAWPMKKWFNTNYHHLVLQITKQTSFQYCGGKIKDEFIEALNLGIKTRPVMIGPYTLLKLADFAPEVTRADVTQDLLNAYSELLKDLANVGAQWFQLDEPALVYDLTTEDIRWIRNFYRQLLGTKGKLKVLLQTYFGDIRDIYSDIIKLDFDAIGLDFVEGKQSEKLVSSGFPKDKILYAGVVNGKNIWRNNYQKTLALLEKLPTNRIVLSTSCSLLHVPYSLAKETFSPEIKRHLAFAIEKLTELRDLNQLRQKNKLELLKRNQQLFKYKRVIEDNTLKKEIEQFKAIKFQREPDLNMRKKMQQQSLGLPLLPTTTIGSLPHTKKVKEMRAAFQQQQISTDEYEQFIKKQIKEWIKWQEAVGLDVLVHGEFERNDMVEYFGQQLSGCLFTQNGWVQSYGTRGVKPPIIWGDIKRIKSITTKWIVYAQSLTTKPVKGMLTGPVTILNWSFAREDISLQEISLQIALAIQAEVLDLEAHGVKIIQIDEAALREKLPIRKSEWYSEYLDWAILAFHIVHSKVKPSTQIQTHMCYSEFGDIMPAIERLDADVILFEASRSNFEVLQQLTKQHFKTSVGPGVYDIHSPRIPTKKEIIAEIQQIIKTVPPEKVWINPDCGLKTRTEKEAKQSLTNLVAAAKNVRRQLQE